MGNKIRGGNRDGLFNVSIMEKFSEVREDARSPTKSGRRTQRIKSAVFCNVVFCNLVFCNCNVVKFIFWNKESPPLIIYSERGKCRIIMEKKKETLSWRPNLGKIEFISAMILFGTIGIFVRNISLPSSVIALVRGIVGTLFLLIVVFVKKIKLSQSAIQHNLLLLTVSGACIGINWILLFEAYRYTTVATATLCYYLAPVFVILVSPIFLKEKLTKKKLFCVLGALAGMVFVSGVLETGITSILELRGVLLGIGAATFYASVIVMNKHLKNISAFERTITQLGTAAIVLLPYTMLTEQVALSQVDTKSWIFLLIVGIVHTGISYTLYFASMRDLKGQTIAILSYIDPIVAIILSACFLKEAMGVYGLIGAVLVLGSTFVSEMSE